MKFAVHTTLLVLASTVGTFAAPRLVTRGSSVDVPNANVSETSSGIYTVIVDNDDPRSLSELIAEAGIDPHGLKHIYNNTAFKGFSGKLSPTHLDRMSVMSGFKTLEPEVDITIADVQNNAPWGLQRISEEAEIHDPPTDPSIIREFNFNYQFKGSAQDSGKDVDIYVVDTGINVQHVDFGGRARYGFSVDNQDVDNVGHG
jgi:cerevisin